MFVFIIFITTTLDQKVDSKFIKLNWRERSLIRFNDKTMINLFQALFPINSVALLHLLLEINTKDPRLPIALRGFSRTLKRICNRTNRVDHYQKVHYHIVINVIRARFL